MMWIFNLSGYASYNYIPQTLHCENHQSVAFFVALLCLYSLQVYLDLLPCCDPSCYLGHYLLEHFAAQTVQQASCKITKAYIKFILVWGMLVVSRSANFSQNNAVYRTITDIFACRHSTLSTLRYAMDGMIGPWLILLEL
jgi:hypothetical protein